MYSNPKTTSCPGLHSGTASPSARAVAVRQNDHPQRQSLFPMTATRVSARKAALVLAATSLLATVAHSATFSWQNFQSDIAGAAAHVDRNLVNPWGMALPSATGAIWVSDNGTGVATLFKQDGTVNPLVVEIPGKDSHQPGSPSGIVSNSTLFFKVTKNGNSQPAKFIFVSEDGTISGWNPTLDGTHALVAVRPNGDTVYKGATLGVANGHNFLFATNFHRGQVDTFDENFTLVNTHSFIDPTMPTGFAPFGIRNINGQIYVTYARQDGARRDDVEGRGNGFIDVFTTSGTLVRRLVSNGDLDSPWGLALVDGVLWVGNFGDGRINNFDPNTGAFLGTVDLADGSPLQFDGLWDLLPTPAGVFFTAGIGREEHGLFGLITTD